MTSHIHTQRLVPSRELHSRWWPGQVPANTLQYSSLSIHFTGPCLTILFQVINPCYWLFPLTTSLLTTSLTLSSTHASPIHPYYTSYILSLLAPCHLAHYLFLSYSSFPSLIFMMVVLDATSIFFTYTTELVRLCLFSWLSIPTSFQFFFLQNIYFTFTLLVFHTLSDIPTIICVIHSFC